MAGASTVIATTAFVAFVDGAYVVVQEGEERKASDPLFKQAPKHFTAASTPPGRAKS